MASVSPLLLNVLSFPSTTYPRNKNHSLRIRLKTLKLTTVCNSTQQQEIITTQTNKKKRKLRPSFIQQIHQKWSKRNTLLRENFPWKEQGKQMIEAVEEEADDAEEQSLELSELGMKSEAENCKSSTKTDIDTLHRLRSTNVLPPWAHGIKARQMLEKLGNNIDGFADKHGNYVQESNNLVDFDFESEEVEFDEESESFNVGSKNVENEKFAIEAKKGLLSPENSRKNAEEVSNARGLEFTLFQGAEKYKEKGSVGRKSEEVHVVLADTNTRRESYTNDLFPIDVEEDASCTGKSTSSVVKESDSLKNFSGHSDSLRLPWERVNRVNVNVRKSNTELAEKLVPEPELRRLRNVALRMVERIKVGAAGVTQALVDAIHEKWRDDEVVKLKFEGPPAKNMKRTHEFLEGRTGGLVIWRTGSSVVLYRGMTYKLPCVQSYREENRDNMGTLESHRDIATDFSLSTEEKYPNGSAKRTISDTVKYLDSLSDEELDDLNELNHLLDELGPRFSDWCGRPPLPVDADLLPARVPGYETPFRLLPYGVRRSLKDKEMTHYRRTARFMPPHFALGRSRELQGLAMAMVKLWERSAIAKIAIKRGVQNTCNERMAEELKVLTGGTLVSRNKDYIVFYRGNNFLSPSVTKALVEAEKSVILHHNEEELARQKGATCIHSNPFLPEKPLVAGTLSETLAATSRWANEHSTEDIEKMKRESAVARHASLVRFLEKKLALAKAKIGKAEKALLKMQRNTSPAELPTDLETLSNEERSLYRKIGLSMKTYLVLGRRGVFDGTVENMHLHWKYRELVKVMVERKNLPQVKHIAISLEAESGGVLVTVEKTSKGHAIIIYRGKNYKRPRTFRPKNLLSRRQASARSIELQRREALKHHVTELQEKIENLKSELEELKTVEEIDEATLYSRIDNASDDDKEDDDDDGPEERDIIDSDEE